MQRPYDFAGLDVTFPHASPHTITARFGVAGPASAVTIDVIPAGGGAALGTTGRDSSGIGATAAALLALGAVLLLAARARPRRAA